MASMTVLELQVLLRGMHRKMTKGQVVTIKYHRLQVFLTAYSDAHFWVSERGKDYFIVSSDSPDSAFGWELKGKRRGFEDQRLVDTKDTYEDLEKMEGLIPNGNQNVQSNS